MALSPRARAACMPASEVVPSKETDHPGEIITLVRHPVTEIRNGRIYTMATRTAPPTRVTSDQTRSEVSSSEMPVGLTSSLLDWQSCCCAE